MTERFTRSGRSTPCPICSRTKDGDCSWKEAGNLVLCHTHLQDSSDIPAPYKFLHTSKDGLWGIWIYQEEANNGKIKGRKEERRRSLRTHYEYRDREGKQLVRVTRVGLPGGKKEFYQQRWTGTEWEKGLTDYAKTRIPVYRYADVRRAIAQGMPIFMVEGEGCADALWKMGIPATTTLGGSKKYRAYGRYFDDLKDADLVLCPDRDKTGMEHMEDIARDFPQAKWCYVFPESPLWQRMPDIGGLDIEDWIAEGATTEDILGAVRDQKWTPKESRKPAIAEHDEPCKRLKNIQLLHQNWSDRIRLNTLTGDIELDGEPVEIDELPLLVAEEFNKVISKDECAMIVTRMARRNEYHPIEEYLKRVERMYPDEDGSRITNLASRYFATETPIYDTFVRLTLVGAVRRILEPGCKHDYTLILQGSQGYYKSSFFRVLAGDDWFDDSLGNLSDKDERLKLHRTWFTEWAELETIFGRKDQAAVKAFLTSQIDYVRPPYGREVKPMKRRCLIVGTTNRDDFLTDPTGARRFWVVPVHCPINIWSLMEERDRIWAAAMKLYRTGLHQDLSAEEKLQAQELAKAYEPEDTWWDAIAGFVEGASHVSIPDLMQNVLGIELGRQSKQDQHRIADILTRQGFRRERQYINGQRKRVWVKRRDTAGRWDIEDVATSHPMSHAQTPTGQGTQPSWDIGTLETSKTFLNSQTPSEQKASFSSDFQCPNVPQIEERQTEQGLERGTLDGTLNRPALSHGPNSMSQPQNGHHPPSGDHSMPQEEIATFVEYLKLARSPDELAAFEGLEDVEKRQIWSATPLEIRQHIHRLRKGQHEAQES